MSTVWPPLDMHAHVDVTIAPRELLELRAVTFAATRRLSEARAALDRQKDDLLTVWGVGTHPADAPALDAFDETDFAELAARTAYVSEVGLDGRVKSRLPRQNEVLHSVLSVLQKSPRITALHSYAATTPVLDALDALPIRGAVLHWWLGSAEETERAIGLGACFSINFANLSNPDVLASLPLDRIVTETDHPDGDRRSPRPRHPGGVSAVESALARIHRLTPTEIRRACWSNLRRLVDETATGQLLPQRIRAIVDSA